MLGSPDHVLGALLGKQVRTARRRATALAVLRGVLDDDIGAAFLELTDCLDYRPAGENGRSNEFGAARPRGTAVAATYARVFALLAAEAAPAVDGADAWQSHLLWRVIDGQNAFSLRAASSPYESLPASLVDQARRDLRGLQWLYSLDAETVRDAAAQVVGTELGEALAPWRTLAITEINDPPRATIAKRLAEALDWGALAEELAEHWRVHGLGLFALCRAARWSAPERRFEALTHLDPIRLDDLVAYEAERAPLVRNTERFVAGLPAHHALLYGERGTGKSSTVKALLNAYADSGLRLVELGKDDLADLAHVLALLRQYPQRIMLFVDDLSFEEQETEYKALKAALEGRVEAWPSNAVLYVTTNRRHLVKERFSDRDEGRDGEVRPRDTMEEKLSLADRFGLHVTFPSPDQERYVTIALSLARAHGIVLDDDELRRRAIKWALWHNGRSCRSARQFVDDLIGDTT